MMASLVKAVAQAFDSSSEVCLFTPDDPEEACADYGATDVMLLDFTHSFRVVNAQSGLPSLGMNLCCQFLAKAQRNSA